MTNLEKLALETAQEIRQLAIWAPSLEALTGLEQMEDVVAKILLRFVREVVRGEIKAKDDWARGQALHEEFMRDQAAALREKEDEQ